MGKKILIVDDSQSIRALLKMILKRGDYDIVEAKNGIEGLELVEKEKPDLIISDVMMPKMDGFEFCKWVREITDIPNVPFIFLTTISQLDFELRGYKLGAQEYLVKSDMKQGKVLDKVEAILQNEDKEDYKEEGISGVLSDIRLIEILKLLNLHKKTGVLVFTYDEEVIAKVYFSEGEIVHTDYQGLTGIKAFNRLVYVKEGSFIFNAGEIEVSSTITMATQKLFDDFVELLKVLD